MAEPPAGARRAQHMHPADIVNMRANPAVAAAETTALALARPVPPGAAGPRRAVWRRNGGSGTSSAP
eukprot:2512311-Lingulodinium_polyedra.AAC.1